MYIGNNSMQTLQIDYVNCPVLDSLGGDEALQGDTKGCS